MDYQKIFEETCNEFESVMKTRLRENNTFRFTSIDEQPRKIVSSYPVHKLVFDQTFSGVSTYTLRQIYRIFDGKAMVKINQHNDIALVTPQMYVTVRLENEGLNRGDIVFPVNNLLDNEHVQVFVPVGCDEEPVGRVSLRNMLPCLNPNVLQEVRLQDIKVTVKKGDKFVSIKSGHSINVGDFLVVRGKSYEVTLITDDDCFATVEFSRNVIYVAKAFENNINNQCLRIRRMFCVNGRLTTVKKINLSNYRMFELNFRKNNYGNSHGSMEMSFSNAVFNSNGFYTRCLSIPEADM